MCFWDRGTQAHCARADQENKDEEPKARRRLDAQVDCFSGLGLCSVAAISVISSTLEQQTDLQAAIVSPEGRVHFVGEHCSL
jgi:hypothetical protein